jgi:arginase
MEDRWILTPYSLDEAMPGLRLLAQPDWELNLAQLPEASQQIRMSTLHESLAFRVAEALRSGRRPVSITGDCCSAIGVAAGMQQAGVDPALIWLDAHGDFNTWETTLSGFVGGMPLAMLVGRGEQTMPAAVGLRPLAEELVILTDARDLDPGEWIVLERSRINLLPSVTDLSTFPLPDRPMLVHFDPDILDPACAPAMSFPAAGGPGVEEVSQALRFLAGTGQIVAVSMATWDPRLDVNGATAEVCMELLRILLGR